MKKITLLTTVIILYTSSLYCQVDSSIDSPAKQSQINPYHVKAKKQKTAAWICLGGGFAMATTGLILSTAKATEDVLYAFTLQESQNDYTGENILLITGAAAMAGSIPLFIASPKKQAKGKIDGNLSKRSRRVASCLFKKNTWINFFNSIIGYSNFIKI